MSPRNLLSFITCYCHRCMRLPRTKQNTLLVALMIGAAAVTAGCGSPQRPQLVTVTGRALMNGKPLTAGAIIFHPDATNQFQEDKPSSLLQLDGSFTIKTFPFGDGVPPGKYQVTLAPELASRIQRPEFSDPKTSPWQVEVPDAGLRDHVFEVQPGTSEP